MDISVLNEATTVRAYDGLQVFYGDIHNHCGLSYGKGSLDEALHNARLQLDFASVTLHGHWDDMPRGDPRLDYLVDYHRRGLRAGGGSLDGLSARAIDAANRDGRFVTFPSFEWHSMRYGDHCVYFRDIATPEIFHVAHIEELRERLRRHPHPSLLLPHHIGYRQGFRGINWDAFTAEFSPVVEIMSFHGAALKDDSHPAYLHAMGPVDGRSAAQYGLAQGRVFGFIGSSDDHSAHPGNYGYGVAGVWSESLTRESIWDAIRQRRTYALTGDRIDLRFSLNGMPMGAVLPYTTERHIEVSVEAAAEIDSIDIIRNNQVIHRDMPLSQGFDGVGLCKVRLELGWGELDSLTDWDVELWLEGGQLLGVEPHLRGQDIAMPDLDDDDSCVWSQLEWRGGNQLRLRTRTPMNATVRSAAMQGATLTLDSGKDAKIRANINGRHVAHSLAALAKGARSGYSGGFVSPAWVFRRAVPRAAWRRTLDFRHESAGERRDWHYAVVRQRNGQCAWSSPIWVAAA